MSENEIIRHVVSDCVAFYYRNEKGVVVGLSFGKLSDEKALKEKAVSRYNEKTKPQ